MKRRVLIEIIIAGLLLVAELIWVLVYRFSGFIKNIYLFDTDMGYLLMSRLLAIFVEIDTLYAMVVLLVNSKTEKNIKIFEIFVAALIFAVETIVISYCRLSLDNLYESILRHFVRLLVVYIHINMLYIIAILICNSENYKLYKTVAAVALALITFVTIWCSLKNMTVNVDGDSLRNYKTFMNILTVFASVYVFYAVGLAVFDFILAKRLNKNKDDAVTTTPLSD